ncbi:hypothetical protein [Flexithrix dorotheae]|uniref:hypothetical protein n=1 Tax=Flexithrix dorotheae TaxID=70993 RepID=UPI000371E8EC|nr:hypothetical protein [Flexithrix dorotheae]
MKLLSIISPIILLTFTLLPIGIQAQNLEFVYDFNPGSNGIYIEKNYLNSDNYSFPVFSDHSVLFHFANGTQPTPNLRYSSGSYWVLNGSPYHNQRIEAPL